MPFNGSGIYAPPGADFPAVAGTIISATKFNNIINDLGAALSNAVTRDGQSAFLDDIPAGGFKITGLGAPSTAGDALVWGQAASLTLDKLVVTGSAVPENGLYLPGTDTLGFSTDSTKRGVIDALGNWAIGTAAPQAWGAPFKGLTIGSNGKTALIGQDSASAVGTAENLFYNGSVWKYVSTAPGSVVQQAAGIFSISTVVSGSAGADATLTTRVTVDVEGNVTIAAPDSGIALSIAGAAGDNAVSVSSVAGQNVIGASDGTCGSAWYSDGASGAKFGTTTNHALALRTNGTDRLTVAAGGAVTASGDVSVTGRLALAGQTSFRASATIGTSSGTTVIFDSVAAANVDHQVGSGYNTSTGIFTAPVAGIYAFEAHVNVQNNTGSTANVTMQLYHGVDGPISADFQAIPNTNSAMFSLTAMVEMAAGATMYVKSGSTLSGTLFTGAGFDIHFSGRLLG